MKAFRSDINGLRAIAVVAVMLFHAEVSWVAGGFAGVDVFFVISGFLMTQIILPALDRGRFAPVTFWVARIRRIVPALLVLCLVLGLLGWGLIDPFVYRQIGLHVAAALLFVSNIQFWRESGYFDAAANSKWLLHTWSLSVEWQFYLVYPLVVMAAHRWLSRRGVIGLIWLGFLVSFVLAAVVSAWRPAVGFYLLPTRAWEMLAGALVFVHGPSLRTLDPRSRRGLEGIGLAVIALTFALVTFRTPWPSFWALLPVAGAAAVIAADRGEASVLNTPVLQTLGRWSYSIYLWHWPVIVALRYGGWWERWWAAPLAIASGIGLGALSYGLVERGAQRRLSAWGRWKVLGFAAACTALVLAWSALDLRRDGFVDRARQPERFADLMAARTDWSFPETRCARTGADHSVNLCSVGPGSQEGTLVIGDSHANQWYPRALDRDGADVVFLTRDGCPPLPDVRIAQETECRDFYRTAIETATQGRYRVVVMAAFWTAYLGPKAYSEGLCITVETDCVAPDSHPEAVSALFAQFARDLAPIASKSRLVFVLPDLEPPGDLPALLAQAAFFGAKRPALEQRSAPAVRAETQSVRAMLEDVAAEIGAVTVDPLGELCGPDTCPLVSATGKTLFRDSNHLRSSVVRAKLDLLDPYFGPVPPTGHAAERCREGICLPAHLADGAPSSPLRPTLP